MQGVFKAVSAPREPVRAKLVVGLLFKSFTDQNEILDLLAVRFGQLDLLTEAQLFTFTDYYEKEMGPALYRRLASFASLVRPETLPDIKLFTNDLEMQFADGNRRRVNVDPGLLSVERLVLATGKNYTHRVYLRDGIYADLTLIYQSGSYRSLPWTYPDYRTPETLHFLNSLRRKLIYQQANRLPR